MTPLLDAFTAPLPWPHWLAPDGSVLLINGDALRVLPLLRPGAVHSVVTDPPYGVGVEYGRFEDTRENVAALAGEAFPLLRSVADVVAITPGVGSQRVWPEPTWTLCWVEPAGIGSGPWGFCCWQPILAYGPDPYLASGKGRRPDTYFGKGSKASSTEHPCAKPLPFMRWLVNRVSLKVQTVMDCFAGSMTTAVACIQTGRRCIAIELDPEYHAIGVKRCQQALDTSASFFGRTVQGTLAPDGSVK